MSNIYKTSLPNQTLSNYTINTSNGFNGTYITSGSYNYTYKNSDSVLKVINDPASLDVTGKVVINGLDLEERLKIIERVLGIPERDVKIEAKYPSIKKKFDDYINTLEKYRTFERIKGDENG